MSPKKLGILILALFALWGLVGPMGARFPGNISGVPGVGIAQAGDPDQYVHKPAGPQSSEADSTGVRPLPPPTRDGPRGNSPRTVGTVLQVVFLIFWGSGAAT